MCGGCVKKCVAVSANIFRDIKKAAGYQRLYDLTVFLVCLGGASVTETITPFLMPLRELYDSSISCYNVSYRRLESFYFCFLMKVLVSVMNGDRINMVWLIRHFI